MIIIYGGAFDPPHQGHLQSIEAVARKFPQAQILMTPSPHPAGASGQHKTPRASFDDRFAMCCLAIKHALPTSMRVEVSRIEADIPPPNFTVKTLNRLREVYPKESLKLMVGQDQILQFPQWYQPLEVLRQASLIVVKRSGRLTAASTLVQDAEKAAFMLNLKLTWGEKGIHGEFLDLDTKIDLLDVDLCEAESSIIRELRAENKPLPQGWLDQSVWQYILENKLYQDV